MTATMRLNLRAESILCQILEKIDFGQSVKSSTKLVFWINHFYCKINLDLISFRNCTRSYLYNTLYLLLSECFQERYALGKLERYCVTRTRTNDTQQERCGIRNNESLKQYCVNPFKTATIIRKYYSSVSIEALSTIERHTFIEIMSDWG